MPMFIKLTEGNGSVFYVNTSHIVKINSHELGGKYVVLLTLSTNKIVAIKESLETLLNLINNPNT